MQITEFRDMYLAELQELCSVEEQLEHAFERVPNAASNPELKGYSRINGRKRSCRRSESMDFSMRVVPRGNTPTRRCRRSCAGWTR